MGTSTQVLKNTIWNTLNHEYVDMTHNQNLNFHVTFRSQSDQQLLKKFVWPWAQHSVNHHFISIITCTAILRPKSIEKTQKDCQKHQQTLSVSFIIECITSPIIPTDPAWPLIATFCCSVNIHTNNCFDSFWESIEILMYQIFWEQLLQHDSYSCADFPGSKGFPTKRTR